MQLSFLARNFQIKPAKRSSKVEKLSRLTQRIISWLLPDETSHVVCLLTCDWLLQLSLQPLQEQTDPNNMAGYSNILIIIELRKD